MIRTLMTLAACDEMVSNAPGDLTNFKSDQNGGPPPVGNEKPWCTNLDAFIAVVKRHEGVAPADPELSHVGQFNQSLARPEIVAKFEALVTKGPSFLFARAMTIWREVEQSDDMRERNKTLNAIERAALALRSIPQACRVDYDQSLPDAIEAP